MSLRIDTDEMTSMLNPADFISGDAAFEYLAIVSLILSVIIFLMQRRADAKISSIIKTQFRRQELQKKYFGTRIMSNLELVMRNYLKLEQYLGAYLKDHSPTSKNKAKNFSIFQSTNLDEYTVPTLRDDLERLIEFIDDLNLVDQLSLAFDDFSSLYKNCSIESTYQESDSSLRGKIESAQKQSKLIESMLLKLAQEFRTSVG